MCGRLIGGDKTQAEMAAIIDGFVYPAKPIAIDRGAPLAEAGFNIAPTQQVNVLCLDGDDHLLASTARWWLVPPWHKGDPRDWKATTFNAKIETAAQKPTFRDAWGMGRCLVLATGYYEWTGSQGAKQPHRIYLEQNQPVMLFAGLQSVRPDGLRSCTILTREALPEIAHIQHRMPVLLNGTEAQRWLDRCDSDVDIRTSYGTHWQGRFKHHEVEKFGARDDGPELIEPAIGRLI